MTSDVTAGATAPVGTDGAMRPPSRAEVVGAVDAVREDFPFPGYMSEGIRQALATLIPRIASAVRSPRPRLLDIGSGPMDKTAVFQRLGFECHAVDDLSDPWHLRAGNRDAIRAFAARAGIRFHLQEADYGIPFPEESFDVVTIFDVIEHLHGSPRGILNTAGSHLRPGGLLAITMPNSVNLRKRLSVLRGRTNYPPVDQFFLSCEGWRGHVREYTIDEAAYICRSAGFKVLEASTVEGLAYDQLWGPALRFFLLLRRMFPGLGSWLYVIARRPDRWSPVEADPEAFRRSQTGAVPDAVL